MVEYFYLVNEDDEVIGKVSRLECHRSSKCIHRSVYVFLINERKELFLQKRAESKDLYPGFYTGSASGHVDYGEGYREAAERELTEELGISAPIREVCKFKSFTPIEKEISTLYLCRYNGPLHLNWDEIAEGVYMPLELVKQEIEREEKKFADGFKIAFHEFLKHTRYEIDL